MAHKYLSGRNADPAGVPKATWRIQTNALVEPPQPDFLGSGRVVDDPEIIFKLITHKYTGREPLSVANNMSGGCSK
jgi:hypothetical protein